MSFIPSLPHERMFVCESGHSYCAAEEAGQCETIATHAIEAECRLGGNITRGRVTVDLSHATEEEIVDQLQDGIVNLRENTAIGFMAPSSPNVRSLACMLYASTDVVSHGWVEYRVVEL